MHYEVVKRALEEDIGTGDVTSKACVPEDRQAAGKFIAKEELVFAGAEVLPDIYPDLRLLHKNGDLLKRGDVIAEVSGNARRLLECERTALNFLQRLSGIATLARQFAKAVEGTGCKVLDTRKTTPGLRVLEKAAAAAGGVTNHRVGLYDAILIKNNHIEAAGGVTQAMTDALSTGLPVEIEVRTLQELDEALAAGAKHLLLDNLTPEEAHRWVARVAKRARIELSGRINLSNVRSYAETGADYASSGAITQSAIAKDISFKLELV